MNQKLPKSEILRSKKVIQELFQANSSFFYAYPLQIRWLQRTPENQESTLQPNFPQVLFVVSKKKIKKAVTRNLIRRRLREVYRKNKSNFSEKLSKIQYLAIIYIAKEALPYKEIEKSFFHFLLQKTETQ
ncbi:MAG: ribonuclease P protein component [Raineya sp.]|nr:ribonuclease P protein component [Raineya sp.]